MQKFEARRARWDEARQVGEWTHANREKNHYDPEIFKYESTRVLAVDKSREPILYLPYQLVILAEALAPKPGLSPGDTAAGIKEALHEIVRVAMQSKIGEVYFLGGDVETAEFAKAHGFEELHLKVMRLKPTNMKPALPEDAKE